MFQSNQAEVVSPGIVRDDESRGVYDKIASLEQDLTDSRAMRPRTGAITDLMLSMQRSKTDLATQKEIYGRISRYIVSMTDFYVFQRERTEKQMLSNRSEQQLAKLREEHEKFVANVYERLLSAHGERWASMIAIGADNRDRFQMLLRTGKCTKERFDRAMASTHATEERIIAATEEQLNLIIDDLIRGVRKTLTTSS